MGVLDLTTLEGTDTARGVRSLCSRAIAPGRGAAPVAAVCVYPALVPAAAAALDGTGVRVASVAGAFPSGQSPLHLRVAEAAWAVEHGADEVDMVISRGALLEGDEAAVAREVRAVREAIGTARLKVILETGELGEAERVTRACEVVLPQLRDGDFIKTSTGKVSPAATPRAVDAMLAVLRRAWDGAGPRVGIKPAGGIRTAAEAMAYFQLAASAMAGHRAWAQPNSDVFRLGASSLLDALLAAAGEAG